MRARLVPALLASAGILSSGTSLSARETARYEVVSPNGELTATVDAGDALAYSVAFRGEALITPSPISMTLAGGRVLGADPRVEGVENRTHDAMLRPVVRVKNEVVRDHHVELTLDLGDYELVVRAFDDAVAYRFTTRIDGMIVVAAEQATFAFAADHRVYYPLEEGFVSHNERAYQVRRLSSLAVTDLASLPALVDVDRGPKVLITESDLRSYPGLWLRGSGGPALTGALPALVLEEHMKNDRDSVVDKRADYLARTRGTRSFPWRVLVVARRDADLLENQTVFKLAGELELDDTSWIRPGKVAWDWYNANNLFGVDFRAGVNTRTYEHYVDFAARYGIEYVILDEGWYVLGDLMQPTPDMDVPRLFEYAAQKGVALVPWVVWKTLDDQLDEALDQFERWGAAGIKVDFMQRDDQAMVEYYERIARAAAEHRLLVDFHGAYKPAGLARRFPNVITREGVQGLEHNKWSDAVTPEHDVTIPFIRMVAGPIDYTPGAMVNAQKDNFNPVFTQPMSQGTRCHQLAMFVVYDSPLQMLADSPSHYLREPDVMEFLGPVPSVWDRTIGLDARVGDYALVARRSGEEWYVAAMTDFDPRDLEVDLGFLPEGEYSMEIWRDGPNADRYASDFARETRDASRHDRLRIELAPGGGWVARLRPERPREAEPQSDVAAGGPPTLESTLEIVNVSSGKRRTVLRVEDHIEAPNWSRNGNTLIYNSGGRLYVIPVTGGRPTLLDTGFATRCNNDHGLSPDGKWLAISHSPADHSLIYVVSAEGGTPRLVTEKGPSYWHGWSPDGETLAYCAERGGNYDVYVIPAEGGEEIRLTDAPGLDDGPDYSPDGRHIYFNSERTGLMKIWRMNADGSAQEQVTFDEDWADWFPHPSPDGRHLVFLSYDKSVEGHPPNQDVVLRIRPLSGGEPRILVELFGGQGTINVPSWSPDGKELAFVSYRLLR